MRALLLLFILLNVIEGKAQIVKDTIENQIPFYELSMSFYDKEDHSDLFVYKAADSLVLPGQVVVNCIYSPKSEDTICVEEVMDVLIPYSSYDSTDTEVKTIRIKSFNRANCDPSVFFSFDKEKDYEILSIFTRRFIRSFTFFKGPKVVHTEYFDRDTSRRLNSMFFFTQRGM